jgi:hypothetical protein
MAKRRMSVEIARIAGAAALLSLAAVPARSVELERGEWRRVGPSFACVVGGPKDLPPSVTPDMLLMACMHMGPFVIAGDARTLTSALGPPHHLMAQPNAPAAQMWFLEQKDHHPYLVATARNDRIASLQVTGPAPAKGYAFNHVNLGDSTETLTRYFGPAFRIGKSDLPDTDVWHYGPWPFSFEVNAGRVISIRIVDPAAK